MRIRSSDKWQHVEAVFGNAVDLPPGGRTTYLDETCSTDPELRAEVERLLRANDAAGDFLTSFDGVRAASLLEDFADGKDEKLIGRYKVVRQLGRGGMGVVYLAEDPSLRRLVAVKLLPPYLHADSVANKRFLEEARAASALDHPNIATIHEIGETDQGQLFITMTYYDGETLRSRIERGDIEPDEALGLASQIAAGLSAAHRKGIVHRDIKPENVVLTTDGVAKIVDFGIAKVAGGTQTQTGVAVGTPAYMSPEQTFGLGVDHRTDLWSLGVVLYEMLSGSRPNAGGGKQAVLFAILTDSLELDQNLAALPPGVAAIVQRCLQKNPELRYESAESLLEDLGRAHRDNATADSMAASASRSLISIERFRRLSAGRQMLVAAGLLLGAGAGVLGAIKLRPGAMSSAANPAVAAGSTARQVSSPVEEGSIAVLPFASLNAPADQAYIGDALADELIHALSQLQHLRVVARTSSFQFKGQDADARHIGEKLGVASVLDGTVRSHGDSLLVTVSLVDARTGYQLWSRAFDRSIKDLPEVQEEVSRAIVEKLRITAPVASQRIAKRSTDDSDAYALYLMGRQLLNDRRELGQSVTHFEQAIARDPGFALAHLGLGQALILLPFYSDYPLEPAHERARASILKSLSIDSSLANAYGSLGSMEADGWRWKEAQQYFQRAIAMSGGDATMRLWYGEMLLKTGHLDEAVRELRIAQRLNPLSATVTTNLGWALYSAGRYDEAISVLTSEPLSAGIPHALNGVGSTYLAMQRPQDAIAQFQRALDIRKGRGPRAYLGSAYALSGRRKEAEDILANLAKEAAGGSGSPWGAALVAVSLGRKDEALTWLDRAFEIREFGIAYIKIDPAFRSLWAEPRFKQLLTRMGLGA